jgi:hypothetical protein
MYRSRTRISWFAVPIGTLIILGLWGPALMRSAHLFAAQYTGDVYAFYLDSGHTFYGTIRGVGIGSVTLSDVYSFQTINVGTTPTSNLTAQALNPITSPENWLTIDWRHVLFFEQLGDRSKVLRIIRGDAQ